MYKIAALGEYESVYGFGALGIESYPVKNKEEAKKILQRIVKEPFAIIYITESIYEVLDNEICNELMEQLPILIPIPSLEGSTGIGLRRVKRWVEKAVGSDIVFKD